MSISNSSLAKIVNAPSPHPDRYLGWSTELLLREIALKSALIAKLLATLLFEMRCRNVEKQNKEKQDARESTSSGTDPGAGCTSEEEGEGPDPGGEGRP